MRKMGNWREYTIEWFAKDWEEALSYLQLTVEEYQDDGDAPVFLLGLRTVVASQGGVDKLAKQVPVDTATLEKMLSGEEALPLDTFLLILKALGCRVTVEPLPEAMSESMPAADIPAETAEGQVENVA